MQFQMPGGCGMCRAPSTTDPFGTMAAQRKARGEGGRGGGNDSHK